MFFIVKSCIVLLWCFDYCTHTVLFSNLSSNSCILNRWVKVFYGITHPVTPDITNVTPTFVKLITLRTITVIKKNELFFEMFFIFIFFCILDWMLINSFFSFYLPNLRVTLGFLVPRAPRGLQGDKGSQASKDKKGRKVTVAMVAS